MRASVMRAVDLGLILVDEKNEALIRIKKDLENQWYTKSVFFNEEVHAI